MKHKLAGLLICVMMLVTIVPITTVATTIASEPHARTGRLLSRTIIRGVVLFKRTSDSGKLFHFFAIRLHYSTISLSGQHSSGVIRMKPVEIPSSMIGYVGHNYIFGSFRGWLTP
jgi:hypothetical protein